MFERNPLAVKISSSTGIVNSEPSGGVAQSQITSMCATGGLTQKQSLRGLLLMHQVRNLRVGGLIILLHSQSDLVVETDWDLRPFFYLYFCGIWPGRCNYPVWGLYPGFSGASPGAVTGWTTMVVNSSRIS